MANRIYIASKAAHRPRWRLLRDTGHNIISRWIDTPDEFIGTTLGRDSTLDYQRLWLECVLDVCGSDVLVCYVGPGDVLKGALVEIGMAIALHIRVIIVGDYDTLLANGTWHQMPGVILATDMSIEEVLERL